MSARITLVLALACGMCIGRAATDAAGPPVRDQLPDRLADADFWALTASLSEPDGEFFSQNLVSNELSFAQVMPQLRDAGLSGGAFIGVGPEQNFSYVAALRPAIAFVIDIRRDNLRLHLMYKALFERSGDRVAFVSRLFGRVRPRVPARASAAAVMAAVRESAALGDGDRRRLLADLRRTLVERHRMPASAGDLDAVDRLARAFYEYGPDISYTSTHQTPLVGRATYGTLVAQVDADGVGLSFLASEDTFRAIKELEARNLVVPVVGNFAGPKAIRAIGRYLHARDVTVTAFYVSNVEDYLGRQPVPRNGEWNDFCRNVATLPLTGRSVFIRPLGLAVIEADGSLAMTPRIQLDASQRVLTYPRGRHPPMPPALAPIVPELAACGGIGWAALAAGLSDPDH